VGRLDAIKPSGTTRSWWALSVRPLAAAPAYFGLVWKVTEQLSLQERKKRLCVTT
jgi:hypothetical protein